MKKKGSRKKVSSHKNRKRLFFFGDKTTTFVLALVFLALVILLPFFTTGNVVNSTMTGYAGEGATTNALTQTDLSESEAWKWLDAVSWIGLPKPLYPTTFIVFCITLLIVFVMIFDILALTSIFSTWVSAVIAGGMAIIASLLGWIRSIVVWFTTIGAAMGIAAGFLEIGIAIVIFVGLSFGSSKIAIWAAKRKAQKEEIKAITGAGKAGAAISGLKMIQRRFKSP